MDKGLNVIDFFVYRKGETQMLRVFDVAKYILERTGEITTMKLQKLVYYSQAWSLVWDGVPLFNEDFQAWANGPVCPQLFNAHKGRFLVDKDVYKHADSSKVSGDAKETIDAVLDFYGDKDAHWLSMLTHKERPWRDARIGVPDGDPCTEIITKESMQEYYGGLS